MLRKFTMRSSFACLTEAIIVACFAGSLMAQPALNTTVLVAPAGPNDSVIYVSNAALIAGGVQLYVDQETMMVTSVSAATVSVIRGVSGTAPAPHATGATVYLGPGAYVTSRIASAPLGPNLAADGSFASGCTFWNCGTGWTATSGQASHASGSAAPLSQTVQIPANGLYQIGWKLTGGMSGTLTFTIGGSPAVVWAWAQSDLEQNVVTVSGVVAGPRLFSITPSSNWVGTLTGISIQQVGSVGNPALSIINPDGSTGIAFISGGTGQYNSYIGYGSGLRNSSGYGNTALGNGALSYNTAGSVNTAIGYNALVSNTSGTSNVAIGYNTLVANTSGSENTAIGIRALYANNSGYDNTAIGIQALQNNVSGNTNTALGKDALLSNTVGTTNVGVGGSALYANTSGSDNVALGSYAASRNTTGQANVAVGGSALYASSGTCCNVAVGNQSLFNSTGQQNTGVGHAVLLKNTSGSYNTAVGYGAAGPQSERTGTRPDRATRSSGTFPVLQARHNRVT